MQWADLQVRINVCGSVRCEADWAWDSRKLPDFDLWYIWTGQGTLAWDGQITPVSAGSLFCLQPGQSYHGRHDPEHRLGVCYFHFDFLDARGRVVYLTPANRPPHAGTLADADFFEQLLKRTVRLHESAEPLARAESHLHLRATLLALAHSAQTPALQGTQKAHHDAMWSVARYIRENPGELFSIEALAERVNYSADHFTRRFRDIVGLTPKEFCIRARLQRAQTLLRESEHSIDQIARTLGYADVFFFSRQFKQRFGRPPTEWRSRA